MNNEYVVYMDKQGTWYEVINKKSFQEGLCKIVGEDELNGKSITEYVEHLNRFNDKDE